MLTTNPIYAYSRGRAQNSNTSGLTAPIDFFAGFFISTLKGRECEEYPNNSACLVSRFELPTPYGIREQSSQKGILDMNNSISIYNFNQNQIRTTQISGEPYFCLIDCRAALGLAKTTKTQIRLSEAGVRKQHISYASGSKLADFINEPNLYRLIFRSNKPQAQAFADWVYSEVLPQIRKTGAYGVPTETAPAPLDAKTLGGVVKRCAAAAVRDELETLPELVKAQVEQTVYEVLSKVFYPGITEHPSGMPFGNWAVSAVHAIGAMTSEYDNLKQKQQAAINLLQDKEKKQ